MYLYLSFFYINNIKIHLLCLCRSSRNLLAPVLILSSGLSGCTGLSVSSFPTFGFGGGDQSLSPDCSEIEKRMRSVHKKYAMALRRESPAIYLTFTGNLSRTMRKNQLSGIHQMSDIHLDSVVDRTNDACFMASLDNSVCRGATRLGRAYKPLVLVARQAHENYCGNRPIR